MTTKIIGTGSCVPETIVTNDDLAKIVETNDEWIRSRTGIHERRISVKESTSELAAEAARRALAQSGVKAEEIDIIVMGTSTSDYLFPSGACDVQAAIGADRAVAFDISAACSGFIFALNTVHSFLKAGIYKTGLIIGADVVSKITDWSDRGTCILFGDGAGAAVLRAEETGFLHMVMSSDGTKGHVLACRSRNLGNFPENAAPEPGWVTMDGQEVFKFAVKKVPECINQVLHESGTDIQDIKYFVLHQANARIFESVAKRLKMPLEKFPMDIDRYGNTSAASIPIILDELNREGKLEPGDKLIFSGFGGGLTWGATLLEW